MTENTDYHELQPPKHKNPEDYTYNERRAEIYRLWKEANDPYAEISQTELSERYDMAVSTIHADIQKVKEFIRENLGDEEEIKADVGFDRSIKKLENQGEWYKAAKVRRMKWEWMHDTGIKEKEPDKHEVGGSGLVINLNESNNDDDE